MRLSVLAFSAIATIAVACGKGESPTKPAAPDKAAAPAAAPAAAATPQAAEPAAAQPAGGPAAQAAQAQAASAAGEAPALDKDRLAKAYQEVYCAQKKGEMDKILGIYKSHGFATPADFTRVWIEAAKDTDWVTRVAKDVSKKCQ